MSERDRDAAVERLLRVVPGGADGAGDCLDAEMLAALADGTLPADARGRAEAHAAGCARCQAVLAAILRTTPAAPAATAPWWRLPLVRWAAPVAAALAAVTIWVVVDSDSARRARDVASAPPAPAAPQVQRFEPAPPPPADARQPAITSPAAPAPSASAERERNAPEPAAPTPLADRMAAAPAEAGARSDASRRKADEVKEAAPAAKTEERVQLSAAPPAPAPAAGAAALRVAPVVGTRLIASPDPAIGWRISVSGQVEKTSDGGVTWATQKLPADGSVAATAGAAPSATVCWIVGRGGAVWLTTDGVAWRRVAFPETVDLVAVTASGPLEATVTATGGAIFVTTDGGNTWAIKQPR